MEGSIIKKLKQWALVFMACGILLAMGAPALAVEGGVFSGRQPDLREAPGPSPESQAVQKEEAAGNNAQARGRRFSDVPNDKWYARAVNYLADKGVVSGMPDGTYQPQRQVTRAEFIKLLAVFSEKDISARRDNNSFTDVPGTAWYSQYVRWGVKEKFITGRGRNTFDPSGPVTRQEVAVILWRFNKNAMGLLFPEYQKTNFADQDSISRWASVEVAAVEGAGLMRGYEDRTFRPTRRATRAEVAQILYQYDNSQKDYQDGCLLEDMRYIMHGGGQVDYYTTSNSLEALEESLKHGHHMLEIDFCWTTDDELACLHAWGGSGPSQCTLAEFLQTKPCGCLTPLSLDGLAQWMRKHPEVRVVPDIKERNEEALTMISSRYPDLVLRFIPYIFHKSEYEGVAAMGYRNIMLALYNMGAAEKNPAGLVAFAREKNLTGIAIDPNKDMAFIEPAKSAGIPVLPFVVDNSALMYQLARSGADGFFTDKQDLDIEF